MHKMCKNIPGRTALLFLTALLLAAVSSCVTSPAAGSKTAVNNSKPVYYGEGSGDSAMTAMTVARRSAAVAAAFDLLSVSASSKLAAEVNMLFAGISDLSSFVYMDTQQTVDGRSADGFYYILGIRINLDTLAEKLISEGILGGQIDGSSGALYSLKDQRVPELAAPDDKAALDPSGKDGEGPAKSGSAEKDGVKAVAADVTADELEIISRYIEDLTYMVFYDEDTASDPGLTRAAVVSANRFLDEGGREWVELGAIEKIMDEYADVYEMETGKAVGIMQWIAHKMNADIYIEVSLEAESTSEGGRYYGSADVGFACFDALTGEERGSAVYSSEKRIASDVSALDVRLKAADVTVSRGMQAAVVKAEERSAIAASHGFKYSLSIKNTSDAEIMRNFEKKLAMEAESVKRISFSADESIFEVYLIGDIADLEDLVFYTAKSIPGLEGVMLVMQRRNSIIFDSGM